MATVIVPAHNEARVIGRLLGPLVSGARPGEFDVIVVANGCTDDTAQVAVVRFPGGTSAMTDFYHRGHGAGQGPGC